MIGFEVVLNGTPICTAGDEGVLTAIISFVGTRNELELEIGGLADGAHLDWAVSKELAVGDEVTVRVVHTDQPDPPTRSQTDDAAVVEAGERKYYERLKQKYETR